MQIWGQYVVLGRHIRSYNTPTYCTLIAFKSVFQFSAHKTKFKLTMSDQQQNKIDDQPTPNMTMMDVAECDEEDHTDDVQMFHAFNGKNTEQQSLISSKPYTMTTR